MSTVNELREHARLLECRAAFIGDDNTGSAQMERDALDAAARLLEREACVLNEIERFRIPELHRVRIRALLDRIAVLEAERNALADEVYRLVDGLDEFWVQQPENARPAAIAAILAARKEDRKERR